MTKRRYSKKQMQKIANLLGEWAEYLKPYMGLRDWEIRVLYHTKAEHAQAGECDTAMSCLSIEHRRSAIVYMYEPFFLEQDWVLIHHMFIHELIHCHTGAMRDMVRLSLPLAVKRQRTHDVLLEQVRQHEEQIVDNLAASFADLIPPPHHLIKKLRKV